MKVFLVRNLQVAPEESWDDSDKYFAWVDSVPDNERGSNAEDKELYQKLRQLVQVHSLRDHSEVPRMSLLVDWDYGSSVGLRVKEGPTTRALEEMFGDTVTMRIQFKVLGTSLNPRRRGIPQVLSVTLKTSEMKIRPGNPYPFEDPGFSDGTKALCSTSNKVTITVSVDNIAKPEVHGMMQVYWKMLQEQIGSDVVIRSGDGKEVKAHMSVLSAHSAVFNAMFRSDMREAKTRTVEIPDMSGESIEALLAYLYCWMETGPNAKPLVALEMLEAGHKYDIPVLEAAMKKLLLEKPETWYDVDVAVKLFLFARNLMPNGNENDLKMKAIRAIKINRGHLKQSAAFTTLFRENPEAAVELYEDSVAV